MDAGIAETELMLARMEKRIKTVYSQAGNEISEKVSDYFRRYEVKNKIKLEALKKGEITLAEYKYWATGQMLVGERWQEMLDTISTDLTNANELAYSIVNGYMPDVYAVNHNYGTFEVEKGSRMDTSYTLYNHEAVERLIDKNPELLPFAELKKRRDTKWNKRKANAAITQGILQGESIPKIAKRMKGVAAMNNRQAVRLARTMTTSAQNAGRLDSYKRAESMGIGVKKTWLTSLDGRTRHTHRMLDGVTVALNDTFKTEAGYTLSYPGDPTGHPSEVYNCRCSLVCQIAGHEIDYSNLDLRYTGKLDGMSYEEWKGIHTDPQSTQIFSGIRKELGDDFVNGMEKCLNSTAETDVKSLFAKYAEKIKVTNAHSGGRAFYSSSSSGITMDVATETKGDCCHKPYQTAFHEFGHNIDNLIGRSMSTGNFATAYYSYASTEYKGGALKKQLKKEWKKFSWDNLKKEIGDGKWSDGLVRRALQSTGSSKVKKQLASEIVGDISLTDILNGLTEGEKTKIMKIFDADAGAIIALRAEKHSLYEVGSISDIMEYTTGKSYPLGVGHGASYHKKNKGATATEFFAEVCDGKAANPESLAQMRRIFPESVKIVEEIIQEALK